MNRLKLFFSNRIEQLFQRLRVELFDSTQFPFARRILIVPNPAIKAWVMLQLAKDAETRIAAGLEVMYLSQAFDELGKFCLPSKEKSVPSRLELTLAIECYLKNKLSSPLSTDDFDIWKPLFNYLKIAPENFGSFSRKSERRLVVLSEKLAHLFGKYGNFGRGMVAEWESIKCKPQWQQQLWLALFNESSPWTYPTKQLDSLSFTASHDLENIQIHLFAVSFLSRSQHAFMMKVAQHIPLHYFMLSPCRAFWLDVQSDWETHRLLSAWKKRGLSETKQMALEEF